MNTQQKMRLVHFTSNHFDFLAIPLANQLSELTEFLLIISYFRQAKANSPSDEPRTFLKSSVRTSFFYRNLRKRNPLQLVYDCLIFTRILRFGPKVMLIEGVESPYFVGFYPLLKLFGIHLVFLMHDVIPHSGSEKIVVDMFTRIGVHLCDSIIVFSEDQKKEFEKRFGRNAAAVHLTHPIYYESFYQHQTIQRERWTILFFGQVRPNKGLDILIQASEIARRRIPDLKVIIAGSCEDFASYQKLIVTPTLFELHIENVPDREVGGYFLRSQCSILPYIDATQSAVLLVSLAFNCPVIAADVGGLPEYVSVGENGLLFTKGSASALAETIVDYLLNEERIEYMQTNARTKLTERFSAAVVAKEILAVVSSIEF